VKVYMGSGWRDKVYNLLTMLDAKGVLRCIYCGYKLQPIPMFVYRAHSPFHIYVYVNCPRCKRENYLADIIRTYAKDLIKELKVNL